MRLLLIGCTGFIGRELVPRLLNSGHHLTIVSRKEPLRLDQPFRTQSEKLIHLQTDPSNPDNWKEEKLIEVLNQADGVINLAGEPIADKRWTLEHCKKIETSRFSTTQGLINAMSKLKEPPSFLLNGSAIGFYGTSQTSVFTEESPSGKDFLSNLCKTWERLANEKPNKTRLVIIRIGIVLESDGGALGKMLPIFRAGFGGPIGDGKQWMSWIHRTDLCQMIETALLKKTWQGVINGVAANPCSMSDFSAKLGQTLGRPSLLPVPGPLLKLVLGDGAKVVLEGQNVFPKQLEKLQFRFQYPTLKNALEAICKYKKNY